MKEIILFWEQHSRTIGLLLVNVSIVFLIILNVLLHGCSDKHSNQTPTPPLATNDCQLYRDGIKICNTV